VLRSRGVSPLLCGPHLPFVQTGRLSGWFALQNNVYRLGLLTHLQNEHVPLKVPECLRDLRTMYEAATIDDVNDAYAQFQMGDDQIFTCVGTSGNPLMENALV
jgi:hypothetical protein